MIISKGDPTAVESRGGAYLVRPKASPSENAYVESFNGRLRDELLDRELSLSMAEARCVVDQWRMEYNHRRPHSSLGWRTPVSFAAMIDDTAAGVFPAAPHAEPAFGAAPLTPVQHATDSSILS